ncbi:MAG: MBL fold metallo-hydrolase RNA specificity domain-containing protein [Chloroflexota bacterium]|jgi:metallo-beta-lactamase family protein
MSFIRFLGAAGTVTGAKFLVSTDKAQVMVDCGLFQGLKELRLMNWDSPKFDIETVDAIVLTHAHLDHTGYIPRLVKQGYTGPIYATEPTIDLCGLLLPDSGHLQEEQAEHANRYGYSKHSPALPLYTAAEAVESLKQFKPCSFNKITNIAPGISVRLVNAGHILGSAIVEMWVKDQEGEIKLVFSGDLGRYGEPLLADPIPIAETDYLLVESTYGNRVHEDNHPERKLAQMVINAYETGGCLLIPAFSVGRTQKILHKLHLLEQTGQIPVLPVFVDSPMAIDATSIFISHPEAHRVELRQLAEEGKNPLRLQKLEFVRSPEGSEALDERKGAMVLISASGMATGGRILHHLDAYLPDPKATVLIVGYQAAGTRGRSLLDGAKELKLLGKMVPVRAKIEQIDGFSAHADRNEILRWLSGFQKAPTTTFLVHGEKSSSEALAETIATELGWHTKVPALYEEFPIEAVR